MAETRTCPRCGATGSGNFCANCGATLGARPCPACGNTPEPGARFCNRCGRPLNPAAEGMPVAAPVGTGATPPAAATNPNSAMGWWVAGLVLVALIVFVAYPTIQGKQSGSGGQSAAAAPAAGAMGNASAIDLNSMTPREAADRLYNRVMSAAENGDSSQVVMFLPMSIAAYERARPLDIDGLYHLSLLQRTGGDAQAALATAREALDKNPDHLLALGAAAQAAEAMGDTSTADTYWSHFLEAYDKEMAAGRVEYQEHQNILPDYRQQAQAAVGK